MASSNQYIELSSLPEEVRLKVMDFIAGLMEQWEKGKPYQQSPEDKSNNSLKRPIFGIAKGMATIAADFDAPLDDFKEYME